MRMMQTENAAEAVLFTNASDLLDAVERALTERGHLLLAIDGRCGCGKSSLAALLARELDGNVFHTDDFYLPFSRRADDWQTQPAGNMNLTRLREEVLTPLLAEETVYYRAYDCPRECFMPSREIPFKALSVVEGSYSQHPLLTDAYDRRIFVTAEKTVQLQRLREREGAHAASFEKLWIPMEEHYFKAFAIEQKADCLLRTDSPEWNWIP